MKKTFLLFLSGLLLFALTVSGQKHGRTPIDAWQKATVNIETEDVIYPQYYIDSICEVLRRGGYDGAKVDSIRYIYEHTSASYTGTAIYIQFRGRRYLISALHVLLDEALIDQKKHEISMGKIWKNRQAIYPRISIRTPFQYYADHDGAFNDAAVFINNFVEGPKAYHFIIDSTGDGIGIISLQARDYSWMEDVLHRNGYEPLSLDNITPGKNDREIKLLDTVIAIGYPEEVSVNTRARWQVPMNVARPQQSLDIVIQFVVAGQIAMYNARIQHYFVNIAAYPGDSGGPIIKDGYLIGIISGGNKNNIVDDNEKHTKMYGVGNLISIINTQELYEGLKDFLTEEEVLLSKEKSAIKGI